MAKVTLIEYTGAASSDPLYAARVLAYTKNTRLNMTPGGFAEFMRKPDDFILSEIAYMATTIPSSWEFVDLIFSIEKASRSLAQQITRTRTATFAMQSQRVTDMSEATFDQLENEDMLLVDRFALRMSLSISGYSGAVEEGVSLEDARDLLPIGVHCNLLAKYNLRSLVELCRARNSLRVQKPYRSVADQMKEEVLRVWPWAAPFFVPPNESAIRLIEDAATELKDYDGAMYKGLSGKLAKAADLLKKG